MLSFFTEQSSGNAWQVKIFEKGTALVFRESTIEIKGKQKKKRVSFLVSNAEIAKFLSVYDKIETSIKSPEVNSGVYFSHKDYGVVIGDVRRNSIDIICIDIDATDKILTNVSGGVTYGGYTIDSKEVTLLVGLEKGESVRVTLYNKKTNEIETREYNVQTSSTHIEKADDIYYPRFKIKSYRPIGLTHNIYAFSEDAANARKFIESRRIGYNLLLGDGNIRSLSSKLKKQKISAITIFIPEGKEKEEKYISVVNSLKMYMKVVFIAAYDEEKNKTKTTKVLIR